MFSAPVCYQFSLNGVAYTVGEIFIKPDDYPFSKFVDLWIIDWIGDFDFSLLPSDLQELLSYPEWVENRRRQLMCPGCN